MYLLSQSTQFANYPFDTFVYLTLLLAKRMFSISAFISFRHFLQNKKLYFFLIMHVSYYSEKLLPSWLWCNLVRQHQIIMDIGHSLIRILSIVVAKELNIFHLESMGWWMHKVVVTHSNLNRVISSPCLRIHKDKIRLYEKKNKLLCTTSTRPNLSKNNLTASTCTISTDNNNYRPITIKLSLHSYTDHNTFLCIGNLFQVVMRFKL